MDRGATLIPVISMNIIPSPSHDNQDWQSWPALQTILPLDLGNQLPDLGVDRRKPFAPLEASVDGADLLNGVVLGLQELTE